MDDAYHDCEGRRDGNVMDAGVFVAVSTYGAMSLRESVQVQTGPGRERACQGDPRFPPCLLEVHRSERQDGSRFGTSVILMTVIY